MKKIISILVVILLLFSLGTAVKAATATMDLKISKESIRPGETFTVSLSITCPDGINGVVGIKSSYDTDKLELISCQASSNFSNLGTEAEADLIVLSNDKITSDDVFSWTFKANEDITEETNVNISIEELTVDSDSNTDSEVHLSGINKTITIKPESAVDPAEDPGENPNENPNENPSKQPSENPNENPSKQPSENPNENPSEQPSESPNDKPTTSEDKANDSNKDKTVYPTNGNEKGGVLPHTGKGRVFLGMVIVCIISLVIAYKKYSKYKGI